MRGYANQITGRKEIWHGIDKRYTNTRSKSLPSLPSVRHSEGSLGDLCQEEDNIEKPSPPPSEANYDDIPESQLRILLKEKDEFIKSLQAEHLEDVEAQLKEIKFLSEKMTEYIKKHEQKISNKDQEVRTLRAEISELKARNENAIKHLQREHEAKIHRDNQLLLQMQKMDHEKELDSLRQRYQLDFQKFKEKHDQDLLRFQDRYEQKIIELEDLAKINNRNNISNRRNSFSGSARSSSRRHSSVRNSRNNRSNKKYNDNSFTVGERYPKRRGIGEQTPPSLELDYYPTKDKRPDRTLRTMNMPQGPVPGTLRFKDKASYEQIILNLENQLDTFKKKNRNLVKENEELSTVNEVLEIENKLAISMILKKDQGSDEDDGMHQVVDYDERESVPDLSESSEVTLMKPY